MSDAALEPRGAGYVAYELCAARPLRRPCKLPDMLPRVQHFGPDSPFAVPSSDWSPTEGMRVASSSLPLSIKMGLRS